MELKIDLSKLIYDELAELSSRKGIDTEEMARFVIGSYVEMETNANEMRELQHGLSSSAGDMLKMSEIIVNHMLSSGALKCKNCTMPLDAESFKSGICKSCGSSLNMLHQEGE
jgi:hypothetical protein